MKPYLIVDWNDTETDAQGWLVVYNLKNGYSGGGTRMHPSVTRDEVIRLAEAMAYKYVASESETTGGCKAGIAYDFKADDATDVLRRFLIAMMPYIDNGVSLGNDLGTKYEDILDVFHDYGIDIPLTKSMKEDPVVLKGIKDYDNLLTKRIDGLLVNDVVTGYGAAFATDEAWKFKDEKEDPKVVIQGFGCVGASCALKLHELGYKVTGIADANMLVTCEEGLDVPKMIKHKNEYGEMDKDYFEDNYEILPNTEWIKIDSDIIIPCALEDVIHEGNAHMINANLIVEAANIPISAKGDAIIKERGIDIVNDYVVNLGSVRAYDVVVFGLVDPTPQAVMDDIEQLCRKNVQEVFSIAKQQQRYQRDVANDLFKPGKSSLLEY